MSAGTLLAAQTQRAHA